MNEVFLSLGGNLGNREQNLKTSMQLINEKVGRIIIQSSFYETAAWCLTDQPSFLNCVIKIKSQFAPNELLNQLLSIEKRLGRERKIKWGSRVIDIDILSYNNEIINDDDLKIPHPFLHERNFVLIPFLEIAPDWFHPKLNETIEQLLKKCNDKCEVLEYKSTL